MKTYDAILICENNDINDYITEVTGDSRYSGNGSGYGRTDSFNKQLWYDDPTLYAANAFGQLMQRDLNNWRSGYSAKVSDFGKWVTVDVTYHNVISGRSASKTFLVVFGGNPKDNTKEGGIVLTNANKFRTISGYSQAVSYIKQISGSLESGASQKL